LRQTDNASFHGTRRPGKRRLRARDFCCVRPCGAKVKYIARREMGAA
jgi:hypothetical protein